MPTDPDVTLDWPDEPGEWVREGVPFIVAAVKIGFSDTLRLHPVNYKAGNDWHEWSYSPGIKTPTGGWRRIAPSPCERCVELEAKYKAENERSWKLSLDMQKLRDAVSTPDKLFASQLECAAADKVRELTAQLAAAQAERDELQATLERVNNAKRIAQQQAEAAGHQSLGRCRHLFDELKCAPNFCGSYRNGFNAAYEKCRQILEDVDAELEAAIASPPAAETPYAPSLDKIKEQVARLRRGCSCVYDDRCASCDAIVALKAMFADTAAVEQGADEKPDVVTRPTVKQALATVLETIRAYVANEDTKGEGK